MRKIFSLFAAILFAGSMMAAVGEVYYTFVPQKLSSGNVSDYTKTGDQTVDDMTWNVPGNWYATGALRIGGKSITDVDRVITGKTAMGDAIAQIVITHTGVNSDNLKLNSITVTAASDADFTENVESKTLVASTDFTYAKNTEGTIIITPANEKWAKNAYYKFAFNVTNTNGSNYAFVLNKIEFYSYAEGGTPLTTVKTVYCKCEQSWWNADGAAVGIYAFADGDVKNANWPGVRMEAVAGDAGVWKADIDTAKYAKIIFTRMNPSDEGNQDWGAKTADLVVPADKDLYTITSTSPVWGNPGVTGEWSVYGDDPTPGPEPPTPATLPVVALAGTMNAWAAANMTAADDSLSASIKVALEAKAYEFKIVSDGKWLSLNGEGESLYAFHRDWTSASHINGIDLRNFELTADVAGEYTFTWTYADSTLTITFPDKPEPVDPNQMYLWNGNGVTKAEDATEKGGAAEAVQTDGTNIAVGVSQKGNWCLKANKGFNNGAYYLGIAMDNAVNAGDTVKIAYFRTTTSNTYVLGMDFSADKASAATTYQILSQGDPQALTSNGIPVDSIFIVPEGVANAKYMRIYRNSGGTGLWVSKVEIVKAQAGPVPPADPTVQVWGSFNEWAEGLSFILATDKKSASLTANIKKGDYNFKMMINGEWRSNGYEYHRGFPACAGISTDNTNNMIFKADVDGDYTFTWTFENDSINIAFPAKPEPVLANGYYLVGIFNHVAAWDPVKEKKLSENELNPGEYYIAATLAAEDSLKVVYVEDEVVKTWYGIDATETNPNGNYIVDANHAGEKTVWFNPTRQEAWAGHIFVEPNGTVGITNTEAEKKAVKTLKNGILVIEKNGKAYNVLGLQVR